MKLFTPTPTGTHKTKLKLATAANIQTLAVHHMQSGAVMETLYKISLFANEEQQGCICVAVQPQSESEPNWY